MKIKKVLVVYKKSAFQVYARERKDHQFLKLILRKEAITHRFIKSDEIHQKSLKLVREVLKKRKIQAKYSYRSDRFSEKGFDLILTVGGDGTFMEATHRVKTKPMLGINSSPKDSVGMFCGATADTFEEVLSRIEKGTLPLLKLTRLSVSVGGKKIPVPVINDVLISHENPAATSRYIIHARRSKEEQKSSGIWVGPAAGSTAALRAAGGKVLPIHSSGFQFVVRELYSNPGWPCRIQQGLVAKGRTLLIQSKMRKGMIYIDGPHLGFPFPIGEKIKISDHAPKLFVYGYNLKRRRIFK